MPPLWVIKRHALFQAQLRHHDPELIGADDFPLKIVPGHELVLPLGAFELIHRIVNVDHPLFLNQVPGSGGIRDFGKILDDLTHQVGLALRDMMHIVPVGRAPETPEPRGQRGQMLPADHQRAQTVEQPGRQFPGHAGVGKRNDLIG